jgi:hypothetical protein
LKAVPSTLRINRNHPGGESEGLGWSVVADDFQSRSAVEDVDQLVTSELNAGLKRTPAPGISLTAT